MGKYASHEEFGINAPINYREDTTSESFLKGMSAVCPFGKKLTGGGRVLIRLMLFKQGDVPSLSG